MLVDSKYNADKLCVTLGLRSDELRALRVKPLEYDIHCPDDTENSFQLILVHNDDIETMGKFKRGEVDGAGLVFVLKQGIIDEIQSCNKAFIRKSAGPIELQFINFDSENQSQFERLVRAVDIVPPKSDFSLN